MPSYGRFELVLRISDRRESRDSPDPSMASAALERSFEPSGLPRPHMLLSPNPFKTSWHGASSEKSGFFANQGARGRRSRPDFDASWSLERPGRYEAVGAWESGDRAGGGGVKACRMVIPVSPTSQTVIDVYVRRHVYNLGRFRPSVKNQGATSVLPGARWRSPQAERGRQGCQSPGGQVSPPLFGDSAKRKGALSGLFRSEPK
jgi:hypothetical protein